MSLLIIGGTGTLGRQIIGITAIIDASTSRPNELNSLKKVDWIGKLALIEAAKVANIKHFIFFSTQNIEHFNNIPLMKLKFGIEKKLKQSGIPYTIFRLTGFYQGLIEHINLCEQLAGQTAKVQRIPLISLKLTSKFFGFFEWGQIF